MRYNVLRVSKVIYCSLVGEKFSAKIFFLFSKKNSLKFLYVESVTIKRRSSLQKAQSMLANLLVSFCGSLFMSLFRSCKGSKKLKTKPKVFFFSGTEELCNRKKDTKEMYNCTILFDICR